MCCLGSCLISRLLTATAARVIWMQRLGDFPSILKRHCKPLSPLREKSTQSNVPLLNSCTDRQHRTSMSAYKRTNKGPPWVHQRYSRHPGNHTSSFSLCTFVCTSAKWNYFQHLQRVFKHKDRDKVRARTTKNQQHVDSIKTKNKQKNNTTDLEIDLTRQDKTTRQGSQHSKQGSTWEYKQDRKWEGIQREWE